MATIFGHALASLSLTRVLSPHKLPKRLWFLCVLSAVIPDLDVVAFYFRIPYESPLGHRGFTHSILFAVLWAALLSLLFFRRQRLQALILLFVSTMSHGILDALTDGGRGVGFFIPLDNSRYFFPFRPISVSPIGIGHLDRLVAVLLNELVWIGIPSLLLLLIYFMVRKRS